MKLKRLNINFKDSRGFITDIHYNENFNHSTYIFSKKNSIRGNHFHKKTTQVTFIIEGSCEYFYQKLNKKKISKIKLKKFDYLTTKPNEIHAYKFLKDTTMLILSKGLRGGKDYEKDTYRTSKKIV